MAGISANPKANRNLESNLGSAFVPNYRPGDKLTHMVSSIGWGLYGFRRWLMGAESQPQPISGLRPPGDARAGSEARQLGEGDGGTDHVRQAKPVLIKSNETFCDLPMLDAADAADGERYFRCCNTAWGPTKMNEENYSNLEMLGTKDAFQKDSNWILPDSIRNSSLINRRTASEIGKANLPKGFMTGQPHKDVVTHLADWKTGFSSSIMYDATRREVVIGFSGLGSAGMGVRQFLRCMMNWLGFIPKNMSQASALTREVKAHIDKLNNGDPDARPPTKGLPPEQQIKLTLTGHSMGGGLASYAALRNKVPAVVFNPMRLGIGARARVGQSSLEQADKYLTEVVVQGDWVSDVSASKLYYPLKLLGFDSRGPLGTARRFMLPSELKNSDHRHNHLLESLSVHAESEKMRSTRFACTLPTLSDKSRADFSLGKIKQALLRDFEKIPENIFSQEKKKKLAGLAQEYYDVMKQISSGKGGPIEKKRLRQTAKEKANEMQAILAAPGDQQIDIIDKLYRDIDDALRKLS